MNLSKKNAASDTTAIWVEQLIGIARTAGIEILKIQKRGSASEMGVKQKADDSLVTDADTFADSYIRDQLIKLDPSIPIVSEESPVPEFEIRSKWSRFWLVDPLDGTRGYANGETEYTVNIALIENQFPTLGVIYAPAFDEMYWAASGEGAFRSRGQGEFERIHASPAIIAPGAH